jgi:hypothetical protein
MIYDILGPSSSFPESHCVILITISPGTSPRTTPALLNTEGSMKTSSHDDEDTPDLPSVNRAIQENTVVILDRPPPPPPTLPSANDIYRQSFLFGKQELDAEYIEGSPHTSRC